MKNALLFLLCLALIAGCQNQKTDQTQSHRQVPMQAQLQTDPIPSTIPQESKTPNLDKLRAKNAKIYNKSRETLEKNIDTPKYEYQPCISCDINFLGAYLEEKAELDKRKITNLLCIQNRECQNNVEFSQLYNEAVWKTMETNPTLLMSLMKNKERQRKSIYEQLRNPINDKIAAKRILKQSIDKMVTKSNAKELKRILDSYK